MVFCNIKSGGGVGTRYLTIPNRKLTYQLGKDTTITIHFIDLFDTQGREAALEKMRRVQAKVEKRGKGKVTAVVCGGDGTVLWVVSLVG